MEVSIVDSKLEHISLKYLGVSLDEFAKIDISKLNWYGKIIADVINKYVIDSKEFKFNNNLKNLDNNITIIEYINLLNDLINKFNKDLANYLRRHEEEIISLLNIKIMLQIESINTSIHSNYDRIDALEIISRNNRHHQHLKNDIKLCQEEITSLNETKDKLINMNADIKHINEIYNLTLQRKK